MGYESRLYIMDNYNIQIASIDMCKMGYDNGWRELFDKPYDGHLYSEFGGMAIPDKYKEDYPVNTIPDISIEEDRYGDALKYAYAEDVIVWCKAHEKEMNYWRIGVLRKMLKACLKGRQEIKVVHFGY